MCENESEKLKRNSLGYSILSGEGEGFKFYEWFEGDEGFNFDAVKKSIVCSDEEDRCDGEEDRVRREGFEYRVC
ncbi:hypothetical protein A2U01_0003169 [Trifolium medium]|uniref:Uncharacterized protein n=1 Tax=Trifolium medium TaxID=97028 RepID=A0A392M4V9_9FABA|nr:hypothetical protein [Trifolium medium]